LQAVVLVGGEGTRLRPLTLETPKPMVPVMNLPFLERTLRRLKDAGIDDVILPAGYLPEAITSYFGDGSSLGLRVRYVIEETPLGTAGALKNVAQYIDGPFFVLNGDVLTSLDLRAMLAYHERKGGLGTLHLIRVDDPSAFGCVVHDAHGRIERFVEKPPRGEEPTNDTGDVVFTATFSIAVDFRKVITATATDPAGNTSEFSAATPVTRGDPIIFTVVNASNSGPGACPWPVSAQRNPSITPAMGFNPYSQRHRCGTSDDGYATGEANIQS